MHRHLQRIRDAGFAAAQQPRLGLDKDFKFKSSFHEPWNCRFLAVLRQKLAERFVNDPIAITASRWQLDQKGFIMVQTSNSRTG